MVKRQTVIGIEAQKHQLIAALYANSAFDESDKGIEARKKRIQEIEKHFNKAVELVYHPELHQGKKIDWSNPFWAASQRARQRLMERIKGSPATVADVVTIEELEERRQKRQYDQS
jgi:low affinity Fe/Cu permease